jgi:cobalamin biosynthesis protein CobD/CbiB
VTAPIHALLALAQEAAPAADASTLKMLEDTVGWIPAVVFPAATVLQLVSLIHRGRSDGVSATTWGLFALANVCLYVTVHEWLRPQVLISTLGTAALQVVVVILVLKFRAMAKHARRAGAGAGQGGS